MGDDDYFGGIFDTNRDGRTDSFEKFMGYKSANGELSDSGRFSVFGTGKTPNRSAESDFSSLPASTKKTGPKPRTPAEPYPRYEDLYPDGDKGPGSAATVGKKAPVEISATAAIKAKPLEHEAKPRQTEKTNPERRTPAEPYPRYEDLYPDGDRGPQPRPQDSGRAPEVAHARSAAGALPPNSVNKARSTMSDDPHYAAKRDIKRVTWVLVVAAILVFIIGDSTDWTFFGKSRVEQASEYIEAGEYGSAIKLLEKCRSTDEIRAMRYYAEAKSAAGLYGYDIISSALWELNYIDKNYDGAYAEEIVALRAELEERIAKYEEAQERRDKAYPKTVKQPYVGMRESLIGKTELGKPSSKVRHNREVKNGKRLTANLYDFYSGGRVIFTARCVDGEVTEVWDKRNTPQRQRSSYTAPSSESDPYNASDYTYFEDYLDDHYDDFYDDNDAEDYYDDHN